MRKRERIIYQKHGAAWRRKLKFKESKKTWLEFICRIIDWNWKIASLSAIKLAKNWKFKEKF